MMKIIGLISGMSWESSVTYYQVINRNVQKILGGVHSCCCLLYSVDFDEIARLQHQGDWDKLGEIMIKAAQKLEIGGADFIVLCTNTMHKVADRIEQSTHIPLLHIADATAQEIKKHHLKKVGLIGTKYTMEQDFLKEKYTGLGIEIVTPGQDQRDLIHTIIYEELVKGIIKEESRNLYLKIIDELVHNGAGGIILGCTEIGLLITPAITNTPLFDTTTLHAEEAVRKALS